jgi:hypothetical protein
MAIGMRLFGGGHKPSTPVSQTKAATAQRPGGTPEHTKQAEPALDTPTKGASRHFFKKQMPQLWKKNMLRPGGSKNTAASPHTKATGEAPAQEHVEHDEVREHVQIEKEMHQHMQHTEDVRQLLGQSWGPQVSDAELEAELKTLTSTHDTPSNNSTLPEENHTHAKLTPRGELRAQKRADLNEFATAFNALSKSTFPLAAPKRNVAFSPLDSTPSNRSSVTPEGSVPSSPRSVITVNTPTPPTQQKSNLGVKPFPQSTTIADMQFAVSDEELQAVEKELVQDTRSTQPQAAPASTPRQATPTPTTASHQTPAHNTRANALDGTRKPALQATARPTTPEAMVANWANRHTERAKPGPGQIYMQVHTASQGQHWLEQLKDSQSTTMRMNSPAVLSVPTPLPAHTRRALFANNSKLMVQPNFRACTQLKMADLRGCPIQKFTPDIFNLPKGCEVKITYSALGPQAQKQLLAHLGSPNKHNGPKFISYKPKI